VDVETLFVNRLKVQWFFCVLFPIVNNFLHT